MNDRPVGGETKTLLHWYHSWQSDYEGVVERWDNDGIQRLSDEGLYLHQLMVTHGLEEPTFELSPRVVETAREHLTEWVSSEECRSSGLVDEALELVLRPAELFWVRLFNDAANGACEELVLELNERLDVAVDLAWFAALLTTDAEVISLLRSFLKRPLEIAVGEVVLAAIEELEGAVLLADAVQLDEDPDNPQFTFLPALRDRKRILNVDHFLGDISESDDSGEGLKERVALLGALAVYDTPLLLREPTFPYEIPATLPCAGTTAEQIAHRLLRDRLVFLAAEAEWQRFEEVSEVEMAGDSLARSDDPEHLALRAWACLQLGRTEDVNELVGLAKTHSQEDGLSALVEFARLCVELLDRGLQANVRPSNLVSFSGDSDVVRALNLLRDDPATPGADSMVALGDLSDSCLKGSPYQQTLGTWMRAMQFIILFRRGRYQYAQRVGTWVSSLSERHLSEEHPLCQLTSDLLQQIDAAGTQG